MEFRLTDDQTALQRGIRELLDRAFGSGQLRDGTDIWPELEAAGLFSLRAPEASGGLGLGLAEAVLAFEELGRALVPGPLVGTELATAHGLADGGRAALVRLPVVPRGPLLVEQLPSLRTLLVLDTGWHGDSRGSGAVLRRIAPGEVTAEEVHSVDPLTRLWEPTGPLPPGEELPAADPVRLWVEGTLLTAALQVGLADRTVRTAVGYAGQREQFGRPIGAFQAVQHLCADMLARTEPARVAVRAAAVLLDAAGTGPDTFEAAAAEVAGAGLLADEAAVRGARDCLQVHGGMGFTWESDVHLALKRAWVHQRSFAGAEECAERAAAALPAGLGQV
ncbi:acyl-CoA dehydrogenase family protein [Streptacidiphilus sp. EB129]|uniref:acyl-CoA dehydrogenase family protein n=1 Tax=Streptacidiphilus sp. EB129 TaxID=3156262 RepID=UPI0035118225